MNSTQCTMLKSEIYTVRPPFSAAACILSSHFGRPFLCFQGGFFRKICLYVLHMPVSMYSRAVSNQELVMVARNGIFFSVLLVLWNPRNHTQFENENKYVVDTYGISAIITDANLETFDLMILFICWYV